MANVSLHMDRAHYRTTIQSGTGHTLVADEPEDLGGGNEGFSPDELLAASLASCAAITVRMYADRKAWPLVSINVQVSFERDAATASSTFNLNIHFSGSLSPEQLERLNVIASKCPIHKTLSNPIDINIVTTHN